MARPVRSVLLVATPLAAIVAIAIGLGVGSTGPLHGAVVFGAPPSDGAGLLAWQVAVDSEEHGIQQALAVPELLVVATVGGRAVSWRGQTNDEGIAEAALALPGAHAGDRVELVVSDPRDPLPLARGDASWSPAVEGPPLATTFSRYGRREGDVAIDVAVLGETIASGFSSPVWVRATDRATGEPLPHVSIAVTPEYGLRVERSSDLRADSSGWAVLDVVAPTSAGALTLEGTDERGRKGVWSGTLSISPGAVSIRVGNRVGPDATTTVDVEAATTRTMGYAEVDDANGRVFATTLGFAAGSDGLAHASFEAPKLRAGLYWIVAATDPQAAQTFRAVAVRPFFVASTDDAALSLGPRDDVGCRSPPEPVGGVTPLGACLALAQAGPFPRFVALDGFVTRRALARAKRARGRTIGLASVAVASLLETILILQTIAEARRKMRAAQADRPELAGVGSRFHGASILVGLLVALLGFGLLWLMLTR
jgi:hypothetical protein